MGEELQIKPNGSRDENGGRSPHPPFPLTRPIFFCLLEYGAFASKDIRAPEKKKNACRHCRLPKPIAIFTVFLAVLVAVS